MKNTIAVATSTMLLFSCISRESVSQESLLPPTDSSAQYFPLAQSREDTATHALDSFVNTWYSQMLFALHEPVLKNYAGSKEIYRFTWLRTFNHPVSIRLENESNKRRLLVKMTAGAGGYEPGKLIIDTVITVTSMQWGTVMGKMRRLDFWKEPTKEENGGRGKDGSEWILEGCTNGRYHVVIRWMPQEEDYPAFRDFTDYLVELSSLTIPAKDYY